MSKERRVDPQVTVGLLTDRSGFPLAVHLFEGNKAETKTVGPVLTGFRDQLPHAGEVIVVADAGMLSAANLLALTQLAVAPARTAAMVAEGDFSTPGSRS